MVRPLHVQLMRIVGTTNATFGIPDLRLEGGTALAAYHLGHRESEDLDFFGGSAMNARAFGEAVRRNAEQEGLVLKAIGPASLGFARFLAGSRSPGEDSVRLDFAVASSFLLAPLDTAAEGIKVASYRDLCAGKLHAICDRFAERDFVDLHVILRRTKSGIQDEASLRARFAALVRDVIETDPGLGPALIGQSISRGLDRSIVGELPLRLLVSIADADIQATLRMAVDQCARLTLEGLASLAGPPPIPDAPSGG